jgi:hypothetical protein
VQEKETEAVNMNKAFNNFVYKERRKVVDVVDDPTWV